MGVGDSDGDGGGVTGAHASAVCSLPSKVMVALFKRPVPVSPSSIVQSAAVAVMPTTALPCTLTVKVCEAPPSMF